MKMAKRKYKVFIITNQSHDSGTQQQRKFLGETWAVSPKQAENNMRFRLNIKPSDLYYDGAQGFSSSARLIAQEVL